MAKVGHFDQSELKTSNRLCFLGAVESTESVKPRFKDFC